jgi:hypothetical protein
MERRVHSLLVKSAAVIVARPAASVVVYLWAGTYHSERLHLWWSAIADRSCQGVLTVFGLGLGNAILDICPFFFLGCDECVSIYSVEDG